MLCCALASLGQSLCGKLSAAHSELLAEPEQLHTPACMCSFIALLEPPLDTPRHSGYFPCNYHNHFFSTWPRNGSTRHDLRQQPQLRPRPAIQQMIAQHRQPMLYSNMALTINLHHQRHPSLWSASGYWSATVTFFSLFLLHIYHPRSLLLLIRLLPSPSLYYGSSSTRYGCVSLPAPYVIHY